MRKSTDLYFKRKKKRQKILIDVVFFSSIALMVTAVIFLIPKDSEPKEASTTQREPVVAYTSLESMDEVPLKQNEDVTAHMPLESTDEVPLKQNEPVVAHTPLESMYEVPLKQNEPVAAHTPLESMYEVPLKQNEPVAAHTPLEDTDEIPSTQNELIDSITLLEDIDETPVVVPVYIETPLLKKDLVTSANESFEKNEDVIGWIRIEGTSVDYPVVQTDNDTYYLTHDSDKKESKKGAIFMERHCDPVSLDGNNILYGHHMKDGSMFASLIRYKDEIFFKSHPIIEFATLEKTYQWVIFAVFITDPSYDYIRTEFNSNDQYLDFIKFMQEKSMYKTDISLNYSDDILILSTCTYEYNDARFVVAARREH